jgi:hypothetical protein
MKVAKLVTDDTNPAIRSVTTANGYPSRGQDVESYCDDIQ